MATISGYAQVRAVLDDPLCQVPVAAPAAPGPALDWLRATVSRFATGLTHARRRALATELLAGLDPAALRAGAAERTTAVLNWGWPADFRAEVARPVLVGVLAAALGIPGDMTSAVATVARGYFPGTDAGADGDPAVELLVAACGGVPDERTAARIGLLVQACEATAGLVTGALRGLRAYRPAATVAQVIEETLRFASPVALLRRERAGDGTPVVLDVAAANRDPGVFADPDGFAPLRPDADRHLSFGAGPRPCPGADQARALACGVLDAALASRLPRTAAEPEWVARAAALLPEVAP